MTRTTYLVFGFLAISMTSCSWAVNLVIANNSERDILVRYTTLSVADDKQFFDEPKTYHYDEKLLKLHKLNANRRPKEIPTDIKRVGEELEVRLAPGQAVHVGVYYSFQPRREVISKHNLKILIDKDSTVTSAMANSQFRHWKNIKTDLLEVR